MDLTIDRIADYVDLLVSANAEFHPAPTVEGIRGEVESGARILSRTKVLDHDGPLIGSIRVEPIGVEMWILTELRIRRGIPQALRDRATSLIPEALDHARGEGAVKVESRVPVTSAFPAYTRALLEAGFTRGGGRVEFTARVEDLPDEEGTPFDWKASTTEILPDAAALLDAACAGDPGHDPGDQWESFLPALLGDSYLNGGPECVHIGRIGEETAAIVVTQVAPSTGWSRITYMGLLPPWRGRGLGRWVHRHGFMMMREQGGCTYQGGCSSDNRAMIALFREHGCRESIVFDGWTWRG